MSQTKIQIPVPITVTLTLDDQSEPQAITVEGTGNMPRSGVHSIAEEALESHFGSVDHGWRIQWSPVEQEDEFMVFEIYRTIRHTLNDIRKD